MRTWCYTPTGASRMGTAIRASRVRPSLWASECPDVKNYKRRLNSVWHRML